MKAFFFGAGASVGTFEGSPTTVPLPKQFGGVLCDLYKKPTCPWTEKYPELTRIVNHLGLSERNWNLEDVWTCLDYYAKLARAIPEEKSWQGCPASREMKTAVLQVYGKRCDRAADQLAEAGTDTYTLARLLKEVEPGDILISFNWDTIIERLAVRSGHSIQPVHAQGEENRAQRTAQTDFWHSWAVDAVHPEAVVTLAKPHGSTSWTLDLSSRPICPDRVMSESPSGAVLLDSLNPDDVDQGREPLVLGTVPIKSELIKEVQKGAPMVFHTVASHWKAVVQAIRVADRIIVVGYSFPKEDQYGRFLIQEAMRLRRNTKSTKPKPTVEFYELAEKASDRAKAIMDAFEGNIERLVYRGKVEPPPNGG